MSAQQSVNGQRMNGGPHQEDVCRQVEACLQPFRLSNSQLIEVTRKLLRDMKLGLGKHTHRDAPVKMLPTFVRATPDGTERGDYLALNLGGTNFRVLHISVGEEQKLVTVDSQICEIPQNIMRGPGEQLFDHLAQCLAAFLTSKPDLQGKTLPMGFTFSFPCEQKEIGKVLSGFKMDAGERRLSLPGLGFESQYDIPRKGKESILIRWTKGFSCTDVEGHDVVQLLKEAIQRRREFDIGSIAMVNDTVGTMMSCGYADQSCEIGMIIGKGTNACYMEEMTNVRRVEGEEGRMCINTEWGGFGDDGSLQSIRTEFDMAVDRESCNPGVHTFEKMISGMYMGEIVRLVLVKLTQQNLLFNGQQNPALLTPGRFETRFMSEIEQGQGNLDKAQGILTGLGLKAGPLDCRLVHMVCDAVSKRSAELCGAALATLAKRMRKSRGLNHLDTTVGVDGTVYKKHPHFSQKLKATVRTLAPKCHVNFLVSEDGSGKGAAMVTAVVERLARQFRLLEESNGEDIEVEEEEDDEYDE